MGNEDPSEIYNYIIYPLHPKMGETFSDRKVKEIINNHVIEKHRNDTLIINKTIYIL